MVSNMNDIGKRVKRLRESMHMNQAEVAAKLGVADSTLSMWESGNREISNKNIIAFSKLFNVSTDYLLGVNYNDIDVAFYNQLGELTEEQKVEVVKFAEYVRARK